MCLASQPPCNDGDGSGIDDCRGSTGRSEQIPIIGTKSRQKHMQSSNSTPQAPKAPGYFHLDNWKWLSWVKSLDRGTGAPVPQTSLAKLAVTSPSARASSAAASSAAASSAAASSAAASSAAASTPPCAKKRRSGSGFALALYSLRPCARLFHSAPVGASSAAASFAAASSAAVASTPPCAEKRRSGSGFALALYSLRPCVRLFL